MQKQRYFETNSDGEQVLSSTDDDFVEVQNDGVVLSVNVVSDNTGTSKAHTYDVDEGYYRISHIDNPQLADELDALFRVLSREFGGGHITRNPGDMYELVVKRDQISPSQESSTISSRTNGEYVLSPTTNHDALLTLDDILSRLTA